MHIRPNAKNCPGKLIDIKCGSQALKRHEACSIHTKAVTSVAGSNIVVQMQAGTSVEEGKLKVVLLHCLKLQRLLFPFKKLLFKVVP